MQRGASQAINALQGPLTEQIEPVDVIMECSGAAPAVLGAFAVAAPAARIVLVGMGAPTMELPVALIQIKELLVTGHLPLRQLLPGGHRAGRLRGGGPRRALVTGPLRAG